MAAFKDKSRHLSAADFYIFLLKKRQILNVGTRLTSLVVTSTSSAASDKASDQKSTTITMIGPFVRQPQQQPGPSSSLWTWFYIEKKYLLSQNLHLLHNYGCNTQLSSQPEHFQSNWFCFRATNQLFCVILSRVGSGHQVFNSTFRERESLKFLTFHWLLQKEN